MKDMTEPSLASLEKKLDQLLELERMNAQNIFTLYRRTTALAHMMEMIAQGKEPRLPMVVRAEIDASVNPEYFIAMATEDKAEFIRRYGQSVLDILNKHGIDAISKIGEFSPPNSDHQTH